MAAGNGIASCLLALMKIWVPLADGVGRTGLTTGGATTAGAATPADANMPTCSRRKHCCPALFHDAKPDGIALANADPPKFAVQLDGVNPSQ